VLCPFRLQLCSAQLVTSSSCAWARTWPFLAGCCWANVSEDYASARTWGGKRSGLSQLIIRQGCWNVRRFTFIPRVHLSLYLSYST